VCRGRDIIALRYIDIGHVRFSPESGHGLARRDFRYSVGCVDVDTKIILAIIFPSISLWRPDHSAAVERLPQGLVQVRVVKHLPELVYGLPISPRMVGNHALDPSQCKRAKRVAAALQR